MKIGVTGYQGNLGSRLVGRGCIPLLCDVTKPEEIHDVLDAVKPDVVIHCAALTSVAYCEDHFKESFEVNVKGVANLTTYMPANSLLVDISTDHVFSGDNWFHEGYAEFQKPSPVNRYGFSKWGGELMVNSGICKGAIVRTSKLFDYNWAKPIIDRLKNGEEVEETDLIKRSFVHVEHFLDGLLHYVYNYSSYKDLDLVHIAGDCVFSYYIFWNVVRELMGLPGKMLCRRHKLENEAPRPFRGGLEIKLARKYKIPIFSVKDGVELLKKGI